eukprot:COSAG01_NODE_52814_length_344_cov_0.453061_1_plen_55_part_10
MLSRRELDRREPPWRAKGLHRANVDAKKGPGELTFVGAGARVSVLPSCIAASIRD